MNLIFYFIILNFTWTTKIIKILKKKDILRKFDLLLFFIFTIFPIYKIWLKKNKFLKKNTNLAKIRHHIFNIFCPYFLPLMYNNQFMYWIIFYSEKMRKGQMVNNEQKKIKYVMRLVQTKGAPINYKYKIRSEITTWQIMGKQLIRGCCFELKNLKIPVHNSWFEWCIFVFYKLCKWS